MIAFPALCSLENCYFFFFFCYEKSLKISRGTTLHESIVSVCVRKSTLKENRIQTKASRNCKQIPKQKRLCKRRKIYGGKGFLTTLAKNLTDIH